VSRQRSEKLLAERSGPGGRPRSFRGSALIPSSGVRSSGRTQGTVRRRRSQRNSAGAPGLEGATSTVRTAPHRQVTAAVQKLSISGLFWVGAELVGSSSSKRRPATSPGELGGDLRPKTLAMTGVLRCCVESRCAAVGPSGLPSKVRKPNDYGLFRAARYGAMCRVERPGESATGLVFLAYVPVLIDRLARCPFCSCPSGGLSGAVGPLRLARFRGRGPGRRREMPPHDRLAASQPGGCDG
jgi:hypothetical protein